MELLIHGHSCCEVRDDNLSIVCDPWLLGSAYWRSWWNFPEQSSIEELIKIWSKKDKIYIYLTHLHWDHFHGPSLRALELKLDNITFIIPRTPEKRIYKDLSKVVKRSSIIEINHGKEIQLGLDIKLLSFQFGPYLTDSAVSIFTKRFCILNLNDSKILPVSMSHLLSLIPRPNYVMRSHSSANGRCCYRNRDQNKINYSFDKDRIEYTKEFLDACTLTGAEYAIPFASNMAHIHKDTFEYNNILNFSDFVLEDFKKLSYKYKRIKCKLIFPSEKIDLDSNLLYENKLLRQSLKNKSRIKLLKDFQNSKDSILKKQYKLEESSKLSCKIICRYFNNIISSTPFFLKWIFKDLIFIESFQKKERFIFNLDFKNGRTNMVNDFSVRRDTVIVKVPAYVLNDVCRQKHFNSLGVSKRWEVIMDTDNKIFTLFNLLCIIIETENFLPFRNILKKRFIGIWFLRYREIIDLIVYAFWKIILNIKKLILKNIS